MQEQLAKLGLKKLVRFRFPTDPAQLHTTHKFFRGVRGIRKNFTKNIHFLVILHLFIMFLYFECTFVIQLLS